ncbi:MAG: bifunctional acetate--CoA ligase family protein/GNAT family N-acetyltransferase [Candidatus Bathyarchaeales archaeon]
MRELTNLGIENLNCIFNPKKIAVIGASERKDSIGAKIFRNLTRLGYKGEVLPVNPFRQTVEGIPAYSSVSKIPSKIDLAVVATPAHIVPQIIEECGEAGVKGAIVISAGFKETGEAGAHLEKQLLECKKKYGIRIIGPNSFGVIRPKINLYATFADKPAISGKIAFLSQSAALCASALDWAAEANVGFSAMVSLGSTLDVDFGDLIDYFNADAQTKCMLLYVESVKDGRKFMSAARIASQNKPIILVKAGRFKECAGATFSHSGSLGGEDAVYDAVFKRTGIVRVEAISDLFNCAEALAMQPKPAGFNLTIITNAGGPAIMAADYLIARGGRLAQLSNETVHALKNILPPYCSTANPIDIYEEASLSRFRNVLEICFKDQNSDGFLVIYTPQGATSPIALAKIITELARQITKPILASLMSEDGHCRRARKFLHRNGIPSFKTPEEAVAAFMYMYNYTRRMELLYQTPEEIPLVQTNTASLKGILRRAFCEGRKVLDLTESLRFLEEYKIPTVKTLIARSPEEASALSSVLGYPLVMKALSPLISHKSKIGGVILSVCSESEAAAFFKEIAQRVKSFAVEFQGVAIQPLLREKGCELFIGSRKDQNFGAVIIFGLGGTAAEVFKDVSIGFPPLNQTLARHMIEDTKVYSYMQSTWQPLDIKLLEKILVNFSQLIMDFPEIAEIDINPLIVNEAGVVAVDARIVLDWDRILRETAEHQNDLLIASYPQKYIAARKLKNGAQVLLRPVKPEDERRFNEFLSSLSEETMRFRFFQILKDVSHDLLARYCNLDYNREVTIIAEHQQDSRKIVGAGSVIVEPDGKSGEFAVVVGDEWQGLGLGSKLMDHLIMIAKDMRLEWLFGYVLPNNYKMLRMCAKMGFTSEPLDEETVKLALALP